MEALSRKERHATMACAASRSPKFRRWSTARRQTGRAEDTAYRRGLLVVAEPGQEAPAFRGGYGVGQRVTGRIKADPVGDGGNVYIPEVPRSLQHGCDLGDLLNGHVSGEAEFTNPVGDEVVVHVRALRVGTLSECGCAVILRSGELRAGRGTVLRCSCPLRAASVRRATRAFQENRATRNRFQKTNARSCNSPVVASNQPQGGFLSKARLQLH